MPFQIKDFNSITLGMVNHARAVTKKITDFQPGSVARTLMEAPAAEIEELYLQMFFGLREAIPEATFLSFGFDRLPASVALGYVSISSETAEASDRVLFAGMEFFSVDGRSYKSIEDTVWPAGALVVRLRVASTLPGQHGNISAGLITASPSLGGDCTVFNAPIETGRNLETDGEREKRFAEFVQALSRGTVVACMYAARLSRALDALGQVQEYVTRSGLTEDPGHVRIYLYSSRGVPSPALLQDGQERIDGKRDDSRGILTPGYRAAGVVVDVLPMRERVVGLSVRVGMREGYELTAAVQQAMGDIYAGIIRAAPSGATVFLGTLTERMLAVTGVESIVPVAASNIVCAVDEALVPGPLTVSPLQ